MVSILLIVRKSTKIKTVKFKCFSTRLIKEGKIGILDFIQKYSVILSVLLIIFFSIFAGDFLPIEWKVYLFTTSHLMKRILMFSLPFLIFPFITLGIFEMKSKSVSLMVEIMLIVFISNCISSMIPYILSAQIIPYLGISDFSNLRNLNSIEKINIFVDLPIEPFFLIEETIVIAVIIGLILGYGKIKNADLFLKKYSALARWFFEKCFMPILPLYILGPLLKITHEIDLKALLPIFGHIILIIVFMQTIYIIFLFFIGSSLHVKKTFIAIRNAIPSGIFAFSTMSSVATMPITLKAAEKNLNDPTIARIVITSTVNCHDVGDNISLGMIVLTIFYISTTAFPSLQTYLIFVFWLALAQFGGVSIPGGSIMIMMPLLEKYLNFDGQMCSLMLGGSILMDPIGTAGNVMGNNAFALIMHRIYSNINSLIKKLF